MIVKFVLYIVGVFVVVIIFIFFIDEFFLEGYVSILVLNYIRNFSLCIELICIFLIYKYLNL